jgi:hypothetical protein
MRDQPEREGLGSVASDFLAYERPLIASLGKFPAEAQAPRR